MLRPSLLLMLARSGIGRLILRLMLDRRVPIWSKLIIPGGIIYMLSPFDIIPDFLIGLGWLDDIVAIVATTILFLLVDSERHLARASVRRQGAINQAGRQRD